MSKGLAQDSCLQKQHPSLREVSGFLAKEISLIRNKLKAGRRFSSEYMRKAENCSYKFFMQAESLIHPSMAISSSGLLRPSKTEIKFNHWETLNIQSQRQ
jgi:hypothetical protein